MGDSGTSAALEQNTTIHLDVAVLGGGFAGVYCAKAILKKLGRKSGHAVGVIADQNYMVFQPMLPEVAGAELSPRHVVNPIRLLCRGAEVYKGEIFEIDLENRALRLNAGDFTRNIRITFDHLVLGLGAEIDLSRVPGMPEHAYLIQNAGDAMKLRAAVISRCEEAQLIRNPEAKRRLLTFVVVGGGYSGVETAAQINSMLSGIQRFYSHIGPDDFRVILVHSREQLLPTLSPGLGAYTAKKLTEHGVELILERRVQSVTAQCVTLDDGQTFHASMIISTVGNAPHRLIRSLCERADVQTERGRIVTDLHLQAVGLDRVWAAGDCAAVPMPMGEGYCPPTAQFAMRQGKLMGENIAATIKGQTELGTFAFKGLGELASLGHRTAVANVMGINLSGFIAWWLWRSIYLMKLPGIDRKLRVMIDWTLDLFFPRDINLLNPRYTTLIKDVYLTKGETLFHAGEPAFSFYVVKDGEVEIRDGEQVVKTITSGNFFGERALLGDRIWRYTAVASKTSKLTALGYEAFKSLVESSHVMRQMFERSASQYRTSKDIEALASHLPEQFRDDPVKHVMRIELDTIHPKTKVRDAITFLTTNRHSYYPVVDKRGKMHGVLSRDAFYDFVNREGVSGDTPISKLEFIQLPTVTENTHLDDVVSTMIRSGSNKLIVTNERGALRGMVTVLDLLHLEHARSILDMDTEEDEEALFTE